MSHYPAIIARPTDTGWEGRYVHSTGGPDDMPMHLNVLRSNAFNFDLDAMVRFLIDEHPAGWSKLGSDPTKPTGWVGKTGTEIGERRFCCFCHGDRHEDAHLMTNETAAMGPDVDNVYVLTPDGIVVHSIDEEAWDEENDPYAEIVTWKTPVLLPWYWQAVTAGSVA